MGQLAYFGLEPNTFLARGHAHLKEGQRRGGLERWQCGTAWFQFCWWAVWTDVYFLTPTPGPGRPGGTSLAVGGALTGAYAAIKRGLVEK